MLATVSWVSRGHGLSPRGIKAYQNVTKPEGSKSGNLINIWPPECQRHTVQQERSDDFRANRKPGLSDGQPCGRFFVRGRNRFVSSNDGTPIITLDKGKITLAHGR